MKFGMYSQMVCSLCGADRPVAPPLCLPADTKTKHGIMYNWAFWIGVVIIIALAWFALTAFIGPR